MKNLLLALVLFALPLLPTQAEAPPTAADLQRRLQQELQKAHGEADKVLSDFENERKNREAEKQKAARAAAEKVASTPAEQLAVDDYTFSWHLVDLPDLRVDLDKRPDHTDMILT